MLSAPVNLTVHGAIPSSPPWKGTENLSWLAVGPVAPVTSIEALNEAEFAPTGAHKPELSCPKCSSTLKLPATFDSGNVYGRGFIQLLLS